MALLGKSYLDSVTFQAKPWAEVKRGYSHFRDGDVLLAKITPCFENGKAGLAIGLPNGIGAGSTEYFVCRPKAGAVIARYLLAFFKKSEFLSTGAARMTGSVGHKRVPKEYLSESCFPLAPLNEQTRIADQLDKLLARIHSCNDRLDTIPALLKRFRQAVLKAAVYGELTNDFRQNAGAEFQLVRLGENTISVPASWNVSELAKAIDPARPLCYGVVQPGRELPGGVPLIRVQDMSDGSVLVDQLRTVAPSVNDEYQRSRVSGGEVLVSVVGTIGRTAIVPSGVNANIARAVARVACRKEISSHWVHYWLSTDSLQWHLVSSSKEVARKTLNLSDLARIPLALPSQDEQLQIVNRVEALFKLADRIESRYKAARAQAQRITPLLLAKAFRGKLVQQDPQDEPASVLLERIAATLLAKMPTSRGRQRIKPERQLPLPELKPADWASLPDGAWAAPADPDGFATMVGVIAVLRAWGKPVPEREARLAALFCMQPRLFTALLPVAEAKQWSRLIGDEARPLPGQVLSFQPAISGHWGRAIKGMRARGDLVEDGTGNDITWALGAGAASIDTAGWPDGRAGFVVAYLRGHGTDSVLPLLETSAQEFADARAA